MSEALYLTDQEKLEVAKAEALKGLAESYGGLTDLLKSSRSLVGYLVSSNKSDTFFIIDKLCIYSCV